MAISRYAERRKFTNAKQMYKHLFEVRDVKFIQQYDSAKFKYPTDDQINSLNILVHVWKRGDKLSKLAEIHYGDPKLWWIIAWFNQKPTESHFKFGDRVQVPQPIDRVLDFMGL